ncbi:autotransporter domain-containing protein [Psychrobacter maritimus]|uniref:autotransporter domain-containing protein n=1 Tax=Psychrobacter maritimus TaxID=256325 RepID=UPI0039AEFE17
MNHVYRVVFNRSLGVYQCVSEIAKSRGKSSGKSQVVGNSQSVAKLLLTPLTVAMLFASGSAVAVTYDNGGTTQAPSDPYLVINDVVTGENTQLIAENLYVVDNNLLTIKEKGTTKVNDETFVDKGGKIQLSNTASLNAKNMILGYEGIGILDVNSGSSVAVSGLLNLASQLGSKGDLRVSGAGSTLTVDQDITNGIEGQGNILVEQGGSLKIGNVLDIGSRVGSANSGLTVTDTGSSVVTAKTAVGNKAQGSLVIKDGASYTDQQQLNVAQEAKGEVEVTGANSTLKTANNYIGIGNEGSLTITEGAKVTSSKQTVLGVDNNGKGTVTVKGPDSKLTANELAVGFAGEGSLTVSEGGQVAGGTTVVGAAANGKGSVTVDGVGSKLISTKMSIGQNGNGTLNVNNGGYASAEEALRIGNGTTAKGVVNVQGSGSQVETKGMAVGWEGNGELNILNGGRLNNTDIGIAVGDTDSGIGKINVAGSNSILSSDQILYAGTVGKGDIQVKDGGKIDLSNELVIGGFGAQGQDAVGTVTVDNASVQATNIRVGNIGAGTLNINKNAQVITENVTANLEAKSSTINFNGGKLQIITPQAFLFNGFDGADTINLDTDGGTISNNNQVNVFSLAKINGKGGFTKEGTGLLAMSTPSKQWTGATNINQGTLRLDGDYTMRDDEVLSVKLNSLADYGKLLVVGAADISKGILEVNSSEAVKELSGNNEWKNVVKATTRKGEFKSVIDNSPLVGFEVDYSDVDAVHLKMVAPTPTPTPTPDTTFVESVTNQSQRNDLGLAYVLDRAIQDRIANGNNELADGLISSTTNFNQSQLARATNQLQPLFMGATNRIITDTNYAVSEAITEHRPTTPERNLWAKIIGSEGSHDAENGITGYNSDGYGAIVGLDTPINSNLNLGVAVSYIKTDADTDGSNLDHELTAKNWQILGYGNYAASEATDVNFHAGAGSSDVKGERHLSILSNATATSDYSVDTLQAGLGVSHLIGDVQRNITPFAQVNYAQAKSDSYQETGAGVYNLNVDENKYESMRWTAGLRMSQLLTPKLALTGQLAAAIENGDKYSDITASFVGMPNDKFTTIGQEVGREIGIAGIGLSYTASPNMKISAGYRGEWRDNYDDQGASIALQTRF